MKQNIFVGVSICAFFCLVFLLGAPYPAFLQVFEGIWVGCACACLVIWVALNRHWLLATIQRQLRIFRQRGSFMPWRPTQEEEDKNITPEEYTLILQEVQRLGSTLYATLSEYEQAPGFLLADGGKSASVLLLYAPYAQLSTEFQSLLKVLRHFGFASLENVRLQAGDLAFVQRWVQHLDTEIREQQFTTREQQQRLKHALQMLAQQHLSLGQKYAPAQWHAGYLRLQGALRLLEEMVSHPACSWEVVQPFVQQLQEDMQTLTTQFEQAYL